MITCRNWRLFFAISLIAVFPAIVFAQDDTSQSLGDVARHLRKETSDEVRMTDADSKKLFESVDTIFAFAAEDTGMPKHAIVKRQMVGKADVEKYMTGRMAKEEFTQRFAQAELSMKKLGLLPRDFNLREFLVKSTGQQVAGYYDEETKTISLLNWVPFDRQEPILAHELTHALQDQNYDLHKWMMAALSPAKNKSNGDSNDDGATARKAVVEGQAMVVYVDYLLAPMHRSLADTPDLIYQMEDPAVKGVIDSQMMHDAPMILRESGSFAYNEGLIFEGELLHKGGKEMAFAGAFARPPKNSHEVLHPEAYINNEKTPRAVVPDLKQVLAGEYEVFDSGSVGELDVRALLKQYGERKGANDISSAWQGGAFVTYLRKEKSASSATTADLALVYVSRWKSPQAADRFSRFYANTVAMRYSTATLQPASACSGNCPVSGSQFLTEEGPVLVERWNDNSVVVSEGFDTATADKIQSAVRDGAAGLHAETLPQTFPQDEIGLRLYDIPAFRRFAQAIGQQVAQELTKSSSR
jgi:hypothetical protein